MAVPFSNTKLRVPKGFQNVLEGLAREVLRCQPDNIYSFSAAYFEELLKKRQETGFDDITLLGAKLEDRFYNNHSFKNPNINTNNDEQQSAAVVIQSEFRRFAAKKEVDSLKEEEAATVIQASFRGHMERNTVRTGETGQEIFDDNLKEEGNTRNQSNFTDFNEEEQIIGTNQNNADENIHHQQINESNETNIEENLQEDNDTTNQNNVTEINELEGSEGHEPINENTEIEVEENLGQGDSNLTELKEGDPDLPVKQVKAEPIEKQDVIEPVADSIVIEEETTDKPEQETIADPNNEVIIESGDIQDVVVDQNSITEEIDETKIEPSEDTKAEELEVEIEQQNIMEENKIELNLNENTPSITLDNNENIDNNNVNEFFEEEKVQDSVDNQVLESTEIIEDSVEAGETISIDKQDKDIAFDREDPEMEQTEIFDEISHVAEDVEMNEDEPIVDTSNIIDDAIKVEKAEELKDEDLVEENQVNDVENNLETGVIDFDQTDVSRVEENNEIEEESARISDDVLQSDETTIAEEIHNTESDNNILQKDNFEELTNVETEIADTSREFDVQNDEEQETEPQNQAFLLADTEENVDAEAVTSYDDTARSEEPEDQP